MTNCSICLDSLSDGDLYITFCFHVFHRSCLKSCMLDHSLCPLCRRVLIGKKGKEIIQLQKEHSGYKWTEIMDTNGFVISSLPLWIK